MELISIAHNVLSKCSLEDGSNRDGKIKAARTLAENLPHVTHVSDFERVLAAGITALLRLHADSDMVVWPMAEESLFSVLRALVNDESLGERVMVELFKGLLFFFFFGSLGKSFICLKQVFALVLRRRRCVALL
jgi:hypothetical protein